MGARLASALALALAAQAAAPAEAKPPTRLFAEDQPIKVILRGPISAISSTPSTLRTARPATLELVVPVAEQHAIQLSPRGRTRRQKDRCTFPPLRVDFAAKPATTSFFERQKRLKLVTHCRPAASTSNMCCWNSRPIGCSTCSAPTRLRARLGSFDYVEANRKGRGVQARLLHRGSGRRSQPQRPQGSDGRPTRRRPRLDPSRRGACGPVRIYDRQYGLVDAASSLRW